MSWIIYLIIAIITFFFITKRDDYEHIAQDGAPIFFAAGLAALGWIIVIPIYLLWQFLEVIYKQIKKK